MKFLEIIYSILVFVVTWLVFGAFWYFALKDLRMNGLTISKATECFGYPVFGWVGWYLGTWMKDKVKQ